MKSVNKYLGKMDKKMCCVVCLIIGFLVGCVYLNVKNKCMEGLKNKGDDKNSFVYCYMNGCPHCEAVSPKWDSFSKKHKNKYNSVKLVKKENKKHSKFMTKHEIKGFPTLIHIDNNGETKECQERDETGWKKFLDNLN